jgi:Mn2+/Fe2+ NRAMP family transporter
MLQTYGSWAITWDELITGLKFQLPPADGSGSAPLLTALATFGIIGVGATELVAYPYWCLEKGYARFTGPRDDSPEWAARARGWMRVMHWDAWCSMVVYTFATVAFYFLGAAVLGRSGLKAEGTEMIRTLGVMYEPVFGTGAEYLFLFGSFAVLYSTFFVASASHARVCSDALRVLGVTSPSERTRQRLVRIFSGLFPFLALLFYVAIPAPRKLVLASGMMQALMLPMLAASALYFRYRRCDARLVPSGLWDSMLWLSSAGMLLAGVALLVMKFACAACP